MIRNSNEDPGEAALRAKLREWLALNERNLQYLQVRADEIKERPRSE